jgi:hypothetical protein
MRCVYLHLTIEKFNAKTEKGEQPLSLFFLWALLLCFIECNKIDYLMIFSVADGAVGVGVLSIAFFASIFSSAKNDKKFSSV